MGLASETKHKQSNLFLFFPMYVCLGIYYLLYYLVSPFVWIWNTLSNALYGTVNGYGENNDLRIAYMTDEQKLEELNNDVIETPKKTISINPALIKAREDLINSIDAGADVRSDKPVTYRYVALDPDG